MTLSPADGAAYWLRWQVFVCGALIALPAAALLPRPRPCAPLTCGSPAGRGSTRAGSSATAPPHRSRHLRLLLLHPFATAISAHGCWMYSKKSSRKADESHGFLNDDVENRGLPTSGSAER
ncbi:unnamed protein product [Urochloa humidicola]